MTLRQTLEKPVNGYWDGEAKQAFDWQIEKYFGGQDSKGRFVRIGCWGANHWFNVALGKTDKLTLSYAKRRLSSSCKVACRFEYI